MSSGGRLPRSIWRRLLFGCRSSSLEEDVDGAVDVAEMEASDVEPGSISVLCVMLSILERRK